MKLIYPLIYLLCIIPSQVYPQEFKSAWLTDIHIGAPGSESDLSNCVNDINSRSDIEFVVVTGNLSETGANSELEKAKEILDRIQVPWYVIPGAHDTRWSESGCTQFNYIWGADNFTFDLNGTRHIGINTSICWQGGGGHVSPETLTWLQQILDTTASSQEIYFYVHHPLNSTVDNWFRVINLLADKNIKVVFTGFTDAGANPPLYNKIFSLNGIPGAAGRSTLASKAPAKQKAIKKTAKAWGYTFVESRTDSILFYEITPDSLSRYWGGISKNDTFSVSQIDSVQQKVLSESVTLKWQKELDAELSASLLTTEDKIFAVTKMGFIYCYDLNGNLKWEYDTGETVLSKPVRDKDVLTVATIEGDLFAFNANNGNVIEVLSTGETLTSKLIKTDITYNGNKTKGVIIGTANGKILCYDMYSLDQIWENNNAKGLINAEPLLISDRIVFGSWDGGLYCIGAKSGSLNWKWQTPDKNTSQETNFSYFSPGGCSPVSDEKYVYITAPDKNVTAVDFLLGRTVWRKNNLDSWESIALTNDKTSLLIKSTKDKIYIVSPTDGKINKEIDAGYGFDTAPSPLIERNGNIFIGAGNGNIYLVDSLYNVYPILYTGTSRVNSIQHVKDNLFAASNIDGKIFVFELN